MSLLVPSTFLESSAAKVGIFAPPGAGKTITSTLLAIGISKELCNNAAIVFVDPENAAEFIKPICDAEGVPLFVVPARSFVAMREALSEAEQAECCAFVVDHYDGIFRELTEAQKAVLNLQGRKLPYQHREELIRLWDDWVRQFRASALHCVFNGRLAWDWGDDEDESGEPVKVKLGTKMRGESDAGYEPNLLVELESIQDRTKRDKKTRSKQGNIVHHAHVLKDRKMILNGLHFQWKDLNAYKAGDYQRVWKDFAPHFTTGGRRGAAVSRPVLSHSGRTSAELFHPVSGESAFAERSRRVTIALEELHASIQILWPGQTAQAKLCHTAVLEALFGIRSMSAVEGLSAEVVESGAATLRDCENNVSREADGVAPTTRAEVIAWILHMKTARQEAAVL